METLINGNNFKCGQNVVIEEDVIIGNNVKLGHNVTLKSGTRIMDDVDLADYVKTTGLCIIGNGVTARTGACISKGVIIHDNAFIGPGVMTNHTRNVMWKRNLPEVQLITEIGCGTVIGSMTSIVAGVFIASNVVIGAGSNVYKNISVAGVYGGNPVRFIKEVEPEFIIIMPDDYEGYEFSEVLLRKYLPKYVR